MFERNIYKELEGHLSKKQLTVITGMRRVGKSTAVKYLLKQIKHTNFLFLDCERVEMRILFNKPDYEGIKEELELRGIDFSQPGLIALDEIQLVPNLPSVIKYLHDTKISSISAISRQKVSAYLQLLEQTYFIYQASPFTKNIDTEISQQKKLYFADTGILNIMAENQLSSGQIFENAIATQLKPVGSIQYYQRKTGQEIDFIFNGEIATEVKETPIEQDKRSVRQRANTIELDKFFLIGRYPPANGFDDFM